jgi:homoserine kinase
VRLTVRVPATSANLGPGFDCFGLALDLVNEVTVDDEAEPGVSWDGEGVRELPRDGTDLVSFSMAAVADEARGTLPPVHLHSVNAIPLERGLGSSSAACVAGVVLARRLLGLPADPAEVVRVAGRVEGHPDNVAAAVFGGFTLAARDADVVRLDPHPSLRPVVLIPEGTRLATARARDALAGELPRSDAVFNLAHAALAVVALTERPELLPVALRDRLHQEARLAMVPEVARVFRALTDSGVAVAVSGAGPSLIAFETEGAPLADPGAGWRVLRPAVRLRGAELFSG